MASSFTNNIRIEEMVQGEQENTWGDRARDNDLKMVKAIAGLESITLASADLTLTVTNGDDGAGDEASAMIITTGGLLTSNVNIIAPLESKLYIIQNGCTQTVAETVSIKTPLATNPLEIPFGETLLVFCDPAADGGNGEFFTINASLSGLVALATNSLELGGVVAADYAQLAVKNTWTRPQVVEGTDVTFTAGLFTPNADEETTLFIPQSEVTEALTIGNPTGTPVKGQIMTFQFEQHDTTPRDVTWGSDFIFVDDVNIGLTQTIDVLDIFTAQWNANLARWVMAGIARNLPRT